MQNASLIISLLLSAAASTICQAADEFTAPYTEWNQPDLQGVWNFSSDVPMQRLEKYGERQFLTAQELAAANEPPLLIGRSDAIRQTSSGIEAFYNDTIWMEVAASKGAVRTSHIVYPANGRLPALVQGITHQPGGAGRIDGQRPVRFAVGGIGRDGPEDRGLSERCLVGFNTGPQLMPSVYNNNIQIVQNESHVVILSEMIHDARIVQTDKAPPLNGKLKFWSGDSRGFWQGDTLVVVTRNFNGLTQSFEGYGTSEHKLLTERFTRVGPQRINYEFSIDDPGTFNDRLTARISLTKVDAQLYEYACHEGNYGMANMLRAARAREEETVSDVAVDLIRR